MNKISDDSVVDLAFQLNWNSEETGHSEWYLASRVNLYRDILPAMLRDKIYGKKTGDQINLSLAADELPWSWHAKHIFDIKRGQFISRQNGNGLVVPRPGRFYPKGLLKDIPGVFRANAEPFRCVGVENGQLRVDFNHPLAGKDLSISVIIGMVGDKQYERGGTSIDWLESVTNGPGMQTRWGDIQTDYFSDQPYVREDATEDTEFYAQPRLVQHIDDAAIDIIRETYARFLKPDMAVLDLMSSWQSHLPEDLNLKRVAGLGMNALELAKNSQLTESVVQDLNRNPQLPYESSAFDVVVCTVSVEYLTDPIGVFKEVGRVLKPEGTFITTFSNRYFPTKTTRIWTTLHEFERMGLVSEYFLRSGAFSHINTYSARGIPRPAEDKYFPEFWYADPVYAVWGRKNG